jgi:glycosyltransferase involved in cell wall biosynthesis
MPERKYRLLYVATHPIQYLSPVLRQMARHPRLDLTVAYCSLQGSEKGVDPEFGVEVAWDIPLLEGYAWTLVPNRAPHPALDRSLGLINPQLWTLVRQNRYDAVMTQTGYNYVSYWILAAAAKFSGTPLIFETDASTLRTRDAKPWKNWVKSRVVPSVFRVNDVIAAASSAGVKLMRSIGVPESRIVLVPFVVDNDWWKQQAAQVNRSAVRADWAIPESSRVVLFCAKLQPWKRPGELLHAFVEADAPDSFLVFAGTGPLRAELEAQAAQLGIADRIRFLGFVNQSGLAGIYRAADLLVLPSEYEPFAVVVNEAMLCGCPVVVSDRVGAARDLVRDQQNGFVYPSGDLQALAGILRGALSSRERLQAMGTAARERMESWSITDHVESVVRAIETAVNLRRQPHRDAAGRT